VFHPLSAINIILFVFSKGSFSPRSGRMEEWKDGRMERWKGGRVEEWKDGRRKKKQTPPD
jgi:hypothetical protein